MPASIPDITAAREVLAQMRETDADWRRALASYTNAEGEIDPERYHAYDTAKLDHGWDLVDRLPGWIDRLAAALSRTPAPR